jgi:Rieske Fe-S protein
MSDRSKDKEDQAPHWKQDFPIRWEDDAYITRREFTKFLGLTSLAFFIGTCLAAGRRLWLQAKAKERGGLRLGELSEVPVGGYKLFRYPTENHPCILLRPASDRLIAFHQNCTHLNCPVHYRPETKQLVCPCHEGFFSSEDGRVLAGPPKRALPQLAVEVREGQIWIQSGGQHA